MKFLLVFSALLVAAFCSRYSYNLGDILDTYDSQQPPSGVSEIRVGIYVNQMTLTDEGTMKLIFYIRHAWKDERLAGISENKIRLVGERYMQIWRPDTFFRNAIRAGRRNNGMTVEQLTTINATGHVWNVMTIEGEFGCSEIFKNGQNFTCPVMIESYGYTMDILYLNWLDSPVDVDPVISLKSHTLNDIILYDCSQNYTAGAFPCLEIRFAFRQDLPVCS